jgi:putative ABC transport system substrate-binding protein
VFGTLVRVSNREDRRPDPFDGSGRSLSVVRYFPLSRDADGMDQIQIHQLRRRDFITLLSGAAAWPLAARAEPSAMPVIGYLTTGSPESDAVPFLAAFRQGLGEIGYVEGRNVAIEYRWAEFQMDRLSEMAADLIRRPVTAIAAIGGTPTALVAKAATSAIPVVFYLGVDPVEFGLVASLNRPGGNMTGIAALQADLAAKRVELLRELVPKAAVVALLVNPANRYSETETRVAQDGASALGLQLHVLRAVTANDFDAIFRTLAELRADILLVNADLFLHSQREEIVARVTRHALPTIYPWREYVSAGGLMSYGPSLFDAYRLVGIYTGKILRGAKPADLPVEQNTKLEFVINLETARTLDLPFPITLLGRADGVIE